MYVYVRVCVCVCVCACVCERERERERVCVPHGCIICQKGPDEGGHTSHFPSDRPPCDIYWLSHLSMTKSVVIERGTEGQGATLSQK